MATRFIHKNGRVIPINADHGDQANPGPQHAAPLNSPNTPAPVQGKEEHNHPEARPAAPPAPAPKVSKGFMTVPVTAEEKAKGVKADHWITTKL